MKEKNFLIITTIISPTEAISSFSRFDGLQLLVVGDKKTPENWSYPNSLFLSVDEQRRLGYSIDKHLPYNHYSRKMIGYVYAVMSGADIIAESDDDNIPKKNWGIPYKYDSEMGVYPVTNPDLGFVNVYRRYTEFHIWPRGFPLNLITHEGSKLLPEQIQRQTIRIGVWQGLADTDPDVDAIYRLTNNKACYFMDEEPIVLNKGSVCPFNSQNTFFCHKALFPLLYLPAFVTFRFTDILRGLVAQPIMWSQGFFLGFTTSTVVQERNPHDYMKDFESEIPCYLFSERVVDIVSGVVRANSSVSDNLYESYVALHRNGIVKQEELTLLAAWLKDIS
jgi:hypothetical protein